MSNQKFRWDNHFSSLRSSGGKSDAITLNELHIYHSDAHEFEENAWARNGRASAHNASRIWLQIVHTLTPHTDFLFGVKSSRTGFFWLGAVFTSADSEAK